MPATAPIVKLSERGSGPAGDAQLPGAGKDRVLDVDIGARIDLGVDPAAALGRRRLLEHRDPHAVGPEIAVEDGDLHLHALVGRLGWRVPVGDDHAAEWIGRSQRNEIDGVERGPPQVGIHRHPRAVVLLLVVRLGAEQATGTKQAAFLATAAGQALIDVVLGLALGAVAAVIFKAGTIAATAGAKNQGECRQNYKNSHEIDQARHWWHPWPRWT